MRKRPPEIWLLVQPLHIADSVGCGRVIELLSTFAPGKFAHVGYKPCAVLKVRVPGARVVPFQGEPSLIRWSPRADATWVGADRGFLSLETMEMHGCETDVHQSQIKTHRRSTGGPLLERTSRG